EVPRNNDIKLMLDIAPQVALTVRKMTPHLSIAAGGGRFITGDAPIHMFDSNDERRREGLMGVGWATPEVEVSIPLSSTVCLLLNWDGNSKVFPVDDFGVANCNYFRAAMTRQYLFYPPGAPLPFLHDRNEVHWGEEKLIELFADEKQKQPATQIMGGGIERRPPANVRR
ncbi:MAG: hypothetical protein KF774_18305, partial [Planctomyces sp.]|nr:hypothetical protein [Planctomyces sp.]